MKQLKQIARIFHHRQSKAMTELKKARQQAVVARSKLEKAREDLLRYKEFRIRRECELYQEFMAQPARTRELELVKGKVGNLLAGDAHYEQQITSAEHRLEQAEQKLEETRKHFCKMSDKLENWNHKLNETLKEQKLRLEIKQEADLDDIKIQADSKEEHTAL